MNNIPNEIVEAAYKAASMSTCKLRKVGAVIVDAKQNIIATGYNHMKDGSECEIDDKSKPDVVHAEIAAIENLASLWKAAHKQQDPKANVPLHMYITHAPCTNCRTALAEINMEFTVLAEFLKFDSTKLCYDLIPSEALLELAKVMTYGAKKYKPNNWKECNETRRYVAALMRHLEAYRMGEMIDQDSGLPHLAHVLANASFLIWFDKQKGNKNEN